MGQDLELLAIYITRFGLVTRLKNFFRAWRQRSMEKNDGLRRRITTCVNRRFTRPWPTRWRDEGKVGVTRSCRHERSPFDKVNCLIVSAEQWAGAENCRDLLRRVQRRPRNGSGKPAEDRNEYKMQKHGPNAVWSNRQGWKTGGVDYSKKKKCWNMEQYPL